VSARAPGKIRIVAGSRRGRLLKVPQTEVTRPTGEKIREAIFDALGPVTGLRVLDLFAGTGAMGLEALSRGARECVFVEEDPAVAKVLRANVAALDFEAESRVINAGYGQALGSLVKAAPGPGSESDGSPPAGSGPGPGAERGARLKLGPGAAPRAGSKPGFDLLFVDPPYRMLSEVEAMVTPILPSLLSAEGLAVIEGDRAARVTFGGEPVFDRAYGDTRVVMIKMRRNGC
jgi:16S rRNA (guanine966-N2)-methyltransferase